MVSTRTTGLALVFLLAAAPAASATSFAPDDSKIAYRYEMRALGSLAGEAVFTIDRLTRIAGAKVRAVRLEARTKGLAGRLFGAVADATTWVDHAWLPVRAKWGGTVPQGQRAVTARFDGRRVQGEYFRDGNLTRKVNERPAQRPTDAVGAFAWILSQNLVSGATYKRPLYDGRYIFELNARVGDAREITLPVGVRRVVPVEVAITRGKFRRQGVYWIGESDRVPYKLSFKYGVLGSIDFVLVGKKYLPTSV